MKKKQIIDLSKELGVIPTEALLTEFREFVRHTDLEAEYTSALVKLLKNYCRFVEKSTAQKTTEIIDSHKRFASKDINEIIGEIKNEYKI